ncbi:MAG: hypothetical protein JNK34_10900 [Tabrizicola sp.]|nr:hypothetical protein [Tabrizicola sp.]
MRSLGFLAVAALFGGLAFLLACQAGKDADAAWPDRESGGRPLLAQFEGRLPCRKPGCDKVKLGLAFYGVPRAERFQLAIVEVDGGDDRQLYQGELRWKRGVSGFQSAEVILLSEDVPEAYRRWWQVSDEILLAVDADFRPIAGNASWGSMLSRRIAD